jgi:hypothetical protein
MRKASSDDVRSDFESFINERLTYYKRLAQYIAGNQHEDADLSILAETTIHYAYVAFERFASDLLISYINRDFSQYQLTLANKITSSIKSRFGDFASQRTYFASIKHIKLTDLEDLLDPTGWNQTFKDVESMKSRFAADTTAALGSKVAAIDNEDTKFIDTMHGIRNFIAHGSRGAKDRMNADLASVADACPKNAALARGKHKIDIVGSYLKARIDGISRVEIYLTRIRDIAKAM